MASNQQDGQTTPVVWWVRNDMRLGDNPVVRSAVGDALADNRSFVAVFIFDPRFLDKSMYGRVTDPTFQKSIKRRRPVSFGNRKCSALRARFMLHTVRDLAASLRARGGELKVCHGLPEDVLATLPAGSKVICQQEPVSVEWTDVETSVAKALSDGGCTFQTEWGAMSLYHREDLPFKLTEWDAPVSYTDLANKLGWVDIWAGADRHDSATVVRPPVAAPTTVPAGDVKFPGELVPDVLADDAAALKRLGYEEAEIQQALSQPLSAAGETGARQELLKWSTTQGNVSENPQSAVYWDLPVGWGPGQATEDPMQWANLAKPDGWMRLSHLMALGCISAREIFATAASCRNFAGVAHRLMWREFHRINSIKWGRRLFWLQGPGRIERPWTTEQTLAEAWRQGLTGVPYIDACMRELRQTGWLAYKGRKTAGHFMVFGLGLDWRVGAFHYEDVLLDYDCAMNYGNWVTVAEVDKTRRGQWLSSESSIEDLVAACKPNIEWKLSAEMANDPRGTYIRSWIPELAKVPDDFIHMPWGMSESQMAAAGCVVGKDYPAPLVGKLTLSKDAGLREDASFSANEERRVHPTDATGRAYTMREFLEYAASRGKPAAHGQKLWDEAVPVAQLSAELAAKEKEIERLREQLAAKA
mmetsp:Transcript_22088/g.40595  ORF Transcript_22088/g.40595 Transcript_22088/m.40595 type:complete len:643 (+) Transcript_22088:87-2015(+)